MDYEATNSNQAKGCITYIPCYALRSCAITYLYKVCCDLELSNKIININKPLIRQ